MIDLPLHSICKFRLVYLVFNSVIMMNRYDISDDGFIDQKELTKMITAMVKISVLFSLIIFFYFSMILLVKLIVKVIMIRKNVQRKSSANLMLAEIKN
jgi:hypothetical protein